MLKTTKIVLEISIDNEKYSLNKSNKIMEFNGRQIYYGYRERLNYQFIMWKQVLDQPLKISCIGKNEEPVNLQFEYKTLRRNVTSFKLV